MQAGEAIRWDLTDLFLGLDDPALVDRPGQLLQDAEAFEGRYRDRIATAECTAELLLEALEETQRIQLERGKLLGFAHLMFSTDTSDPARGALLQRLQEQSTAISRHLIFFDLEVGRMPEKTFSALIISPQLSKYRHYLEHEREVARHNLEEGEEKIAAELGNTGAQAFQRLFSEVTSRMTFRVTVEGKAQDLNQSQVLNLLFEPDRDLRRRAAAAISRTLERHSHLLVFIYNTVLLEKATQDRLRGYEYPEQRRHQSNELSAEVVDTLTEVCAANYEVVADYYRLKARLLGLKRLKHYDRYAPLRQAEAWIAFGEARDTVLEAFRRFSPTLEQVTREFFDGNWIDAEVRPGKRGGAFCSSVSPDLHPYVFMNYLGKPRDVMTLAHELGHGVHGMLSRRQPYFEYYASLALAETASVFGEMLVFEELQRRLDDPAERLALLAGRLEDSFGTVFRQVSMYRFERRAHRARREEGELTGERYDAIWQSVMQEMFGDSLELEPGHSSWWLYVPHFYHTPFYVYAYAFGELLVLALYARYREQGEAFVEPYLNLLRAGGSRRPEELLGELGMDVRSPAFWQGGVDVIRGMLTTARELAKEVHGII